MAQDTVLSVTQALPASNASNASPTLDLKILAGNPSDWRVGYILASVPALTNNTSTTITLKMQTAPPVTAAGTFPPNAGTFADTNPSIVGTITGVGSTGSTAKSLKFPLIPGTYGFLRFVQSVGSGDGDSTASSVTYTFESGNRE